MFSPFTIALKYLHYRLTSSNGKGHGTHSPFVYNFIRKILNDRADYPAYHSVEALRKKLLNDHSPVPVEEYGAGSVSGKASATVSSITRRSAKNRKYGQLLFRIANHYQPERILELGTSMGVSTAYLALATENSVVVSGEGNAAIAALAEKNLAFLGIYNVKIVRGNFDDTLPKMLDEIQKAGLVFLDGNHRLEPTLRYFAAALDHIAERSVIIVDDIHWSREMEMAWEKIQAGPSVMLTVDLFFMGIVFFAPEFKVKQHFRIRF